MADEAKLTQFRPDGLLFGQALDVGIEAEEVRDGRLVHGENVDKVLRVAPDAKFGAAAPLALARREVRVHIFPFDLYIMYIYIYRERERERERNLSSNG